MLFSFFLLVIELNETKVNGKSFILGLITRRSRHRPGTRYFSRGVDVNGNVSNYVETEQVVLYEDAGKKHQLSYVQTRGSIPVYWAQLINLKYTPRLWVGDSKKSVSFFFHFFTIFINILSLSYINFYNYYIFVLN